MKSIKYRSLSGKTMRMMRQEAEERRLSSEWVITIKELRDKYATQGRIDI